MKSLPPVQQGTDGIRRFSDPQLQASIERALASLPPDHAGAVVDVGFDSEGIQAIFAYKLNRQWSVVGGVEKRYQGEFSGHAAVRWSGGL